MSGSDLTGEMMLRHARNLKTALEFFKIGSKAISLDRVELPDDDAWVSVHDYVAKVLIYSGSWDGGTTEPVEQIYGDRASFAQSAMLALLHFSRNDAEQARAAILAVDAFANLRLGVLRRFAIEIQRTLDRQEK